MNATQLNIKDQIIDLINKNKGLTAFCKTFLRGAASKNSNFTAEDYQEMLNSNISNEFKRMVLTGITKITELNEIIRANAQAYLHNLEIKKALKAAKNAHEHEHSGWFAMDPEDDAPQIQLILENAKIKVKEGLFASSAELITKELYSMQLRLAYSRRRYAGAIKDYQFKIEEHHKEYRQLTLERGLNLHDRHLARLHDFHTEYHSKDCPKHRARVVQEFVQLAPTPKHQDVDELHEKIHTFFDSRFIMQVMRRHAADHTEFRALIDQHANLVIFYQQNTIKLQSSLNQTLQQWQMKNPVFENGPKSVATQNPMQPESAVNYKTPFDLTPPNPTQI